jgi:phosphohistidine phosphatase SixA
VLAAAVGASIRKARIPVGDIFSSPLCRAKESAEAAFGTKFVINPLLMYTSNLTDEEKMPIVAETRRLLSAPVKAGTNRVLVAHAPNMMDVIGLFPKPEGSVIVIRPLGNDTFEYVASIAPDAWAGLIQVAK